MKPVVLIPAYNPTDDLVGFVRQLAATDPEAIVIVDDGSSKECNSIFQDVDQIEKVILLKHAVNLGKGAALKTGLNYVYSAYASMIGVITADADGQHSVDDVQKVVRVLIDHPEHLVMGIRRFNTWVPLRSMIGNSMTKYLFWMLVGKKMSDTQTGLRGIPRGFISQLLNIDSDRYEFEMDMLLACMYRKRPIIEQEIRTIYHHDRRTSHFHPVIDSMRIYFVLARFAIISFTTVIIDCSVFLSLYNHGLTHLRNLFSACLVALRYNYLAVKK